MWIVLLALRRPLSVAVLTLLMLVLGVLAFTRMNVQHIPGDRSAGSDSGVELPGAIGD